MHLKVLQLKDLTKYGFMSYEFAKRKGFSLDDYKVVYETEVDADHDLDYFFTIFNVGEKPDGYEGHSLSTSDILDLDGKKYYCDSIGWVELN